MTHPTDEILLKYVLELLEGEALATAREHLAACDDCRTAIRRIEQEQRVFAGFAPDLPRTVYPLPKREDKRERRWLKVAAVLLIGFAAGFGASSLMQPECVNVVPYHARAVQTAAPLPVTCEMVTLAVVP